MQKWTFDFLLIMLISPKTTPKDGITENDLIISENIHYHGSLILKSEMDDVAQKSSVIFHVKLDYHFCDVPGCLRL